MHSEISSKRFRSVLVMGMALTASACVSTIGVDIPDTTSPYSSFQAVVTVEVNEGGESWGYLGLVVPSGWEAGDASYTGPCQGSMSSSSVFENWACAPWDHWLGFQSDSLCSGNVGDTYIITVTVFTDMIVGEVDMSFLGAIEYQGNPSYSGDPCTTTVNVIETSLDRVTWGDLKSGYIR